MTVHPADRGPTILAVYALFVVLTTVTAFLRFYCRLFIQRAFGWDDWWALIAWVFFVLFASFAITGVYHGTGQHIDAIQPPTEVPVGLKFWWLCEPVYVLSTMAIKASLGVMLLRLSVRTSHKVIVWTVLAVAELYSAAYFCLFVFQCIPSAYFWTRYTGGTGSCIDPNITVAATYAYSAISCVGDWILSTLPIFLVWNLQLGRREKASVILILSMGALASTATIARIPYVRGLSNQSDFLYSTTDVAIWSCSETGLGITATCCATLRPLLRRLFSSSAGSNGSNSNSRRHAEMDRVASLRLSRRSRHASGDDDFLELDGLEKRNGFGTLTSVWASGKKGDKCYVEIGSTSSQAMILDTSTKVHRQESAWSQ